MKSVKCANCGNSIEPTDKFCQHCGAAVQSSGSEASETKTKESFKTFSSAGNYSGTISKGKGSGTRKIIRNIIIAIVLIGIVAIVIWIKTDPNAKEKLGNILFGFVVMAIFAAVIWQKSRKGKIQSAKQRQANYDWDDMDEPDNDDFDDD